jgi:hypothetical protein
MTLSRSASGDDDYHDRILQSLRDNGMESLPGPDPVALVTYGPQDGEGRIEIKVNDQYAGAVWRMPECDTRYTFIIHGMAFICGLENGKRIIQALVEAHLRQ